jgi:NADH-quinone oxidoreductase subunit D
MTATDLSRTAEGAQEMGPRKGATADELLRELGAVLRMSEAEAAALSEQEDDAAEQTMLLNMGPQHPSTHGVLRLMLELQGEEVLRTKPIIGYLHTGMEKTGETLTYLQGGTNTTRMDYAAPLFNELVFCLAAETLLGIEDDVPARAQWIRTLLCELNRMSSHLLFLATNGMDLGAVSMMIYGWREREETLRLLEMITGLRMNHNFIRVGGVAADLPDGWRDATLRVLDLVEPRLAEYEVLMTGQPIWRERLQGVGVITSEEAIALGATGPILRSTGVPWDLRRADPYLCYDELDFSVIVGSYGDCFDRYSIRLNEVRESMAIVRQILEKLPAGDYRIQDRKVTPPPRGRIDESMEALIHHFKIFTEGFKVPEGEVYRAIESPRGEHALPHAHPGAVVREPADDAPHAARRPHRRRRRRHLVGRPDHGRGRPLMPRFTADNTAVAEEIIARYPVRKSALIPLLHLAQEQDGHLTDDAMANIAELVGVTPAEVLGTASFYEMFKREPVGDYVVNVCTNISCMLLGGEELLHHLEQRLGLKAGDTTPDGKFTLEDVECIAACTEAPCLQVNYRYYHRVSNDEVDALLDDLRAGKRAHEVPRHGTLGRVRQQLPDTRAGVAPPDRNVEPAWFARNETADGDKEASS